MLCSISIYGTDECKSTTELRKLLATISIPFQYHNVNHESEAARTVKDMNNGKLISPLVIVGATVMLNPTVLQLNVALHSNGILNPHRCAKSEEPVTKSSSWAQSSSRRRATYANYS